MKTSACLVLSLSFLAAMLVGCRPALGLPEGAGGGGGRGGGGGEGDVELTLEPAAEPGAAPRAVRFRIRSRRAIDASLVRFVRGDVGPGHLEQLAMDDPSNALEKRILPASVWAEGDEVVVAPHGMLEEDERYAVAVPDHAEAFEIRARLADGDPVLPRLWPPHDAVAFDAFLLFCGAAMLDFASHEEKFAPGGTPARLSPGATAEGAGRRCAHVRGEGLLPPGTLLLPPPSLEAGGVRYGLDPTPLVIGDPGSAPIDALVCEGAEVAVGPGCASVLDDRAIVRTPEEPRLWIVGGGEVDLVVVTAPGEPFAVHPLPVDADVSLEVTSVDAGGRASFSHVEAHTKPAMPHVVLDEVLANAVGPEPASEWVEIVNDGTLDVRLGGYVIADPGGEVELPDVTLEAGEIALVVGDGWTGDGLDDVAPPPGALVLHVPRIGRSGISNGGEPLRLRDPVGAIVSTIPAIASPDPGMSTARREPWLADAPSSFSSAIPTPGAPNEAAAGTP